MKKIILFFLLLSVVSQIHAQNQPEGIPISIGYFGHYFIQPGLKIGTAFSLKSWEAKRNDNRIKAFVISPQIGGFTRPGNHTGILVSAELGYNRQNEKGNSFSTLSIGLGFLTQYDIVSLTVNLGNGDSIEKSRKRQGYFIPTINYEFGRAIHQKMDWYAKFSYGARLSAAQEGAGVIFTELGIRFKLQKSRDL